RLFLRSCKLPGVVVIPPLPPMLLEPLPSAGSLGSTDIAPLPRYYGPLQFPLVFRRLPGVSGYTTSCSGDFSPGRGGSLQLLSMPWSSCCRFNPARMKRRVSQAATVPAAFTLRKWARLLGFPLFEAISPFTDATARSL